MILGSSCDAVKEEWQAQGKVASAHLIRPHASHPTSGHGTRLVVGLTTAAGLPAQNLKGDAGRLCLSIPNCLRRYLFIETERLPVDLSKEGDEVCWSAPSQEDGRKSSAPHAAAEPSTVEDALLPGDDDDVWLRPFRSRLTGREERQGGGEYVGPLVSGDSDVATRAQLSGSCRSTVYPNMVGWELFVDPNIRWAFSQQSAG